MGASSSRAFRLLIIGFLVTLLILGIAIRSVTIKAMTKSALQELENSSHILSQLAASYYADGTMTNMQFMINLDLTSKVSGVDVLICNETGRIILCSDSPTGCVHQSYYFPDTYLQQVRDRGHISQESLLTNIYNETRFSSARPVYSSASGQVVGYVVVSTPQSEASKMATQVSNFFLIGISIVTLLTAIMMAYVANHRSTPLREMAKAARSFGHGDLDARVQLKGAHSEEMEDLALAFNNMASSLQKSEYSRQEFVANVSHELKTPMTTIGGYIDGILDGTIPPEKSRQYMRIVSEETKRLSRLVRSMLDISRLQEQGIPEKEKSNFDIGECAGQVLISFEQKITDKKLEVDASLPEFPAYTFAHRDAITQVLYNLTDNAVKFCPEGGKLGLQIRDNGHKLFITVSNSGPTIPAEELPMLFDRFHKLDRSRSTNRESWGLGLYIVKTIVCNHGEDISVTSKNNHTEFTFTLPMVN